MLRVSPDLVVAVINSHENTDPCSNFREIITHLYLSILYTRKRILFCNFSTTVSQQFKDPSYSQSMTRFLLGAASLFIIQPREKESVICIYA